MFTGIIFEKGKIVSIAPGKISVEMNLNVSPGESVAVDGVCLTVVKQRGRIVNFDLLPQTWERTAFKYRRAGEEVNLELPSTPQTMLSGHIVQGHVDGVGRVVQVHRKGSALRVKFHAAEEVLKYLVPRGSVAVNGVSLTVSELDRDGFYVELIPETQKRTNLGNLRVGYYVNLEADIIGKYVLAFLEKREKH